MLDLDQLPNPNSLTPLRREIVALVREGRFRHEISSALGVTSVVVAAEIQAIYATLEINDLLSLAFYANYHDLRPLTEPKVDDQATGADTTPLHRESA